MQPSPWYHGLVGVSTKRPMARGRNRPRRQFRRAILTFFVLGSVGLTFAACGGTSGPGVASVGSSTTTTVAPASQGGSNGSNGEAQLLKYSQCMRAHGLPNFPDPNSQGDLSIGPGNVPKGGPNSPQFKAAQKACQSLMPGALITSAQKAAANIKALAFAQCMRAHGVANFPDPNGQGLIEITPATHVDMNSRQYNEAQSACQNLSNGFDMMIRGGRGPAAPKGNSGS
jgi:hypothetical protein